MTSDRDEDLPSWLRTVLPFGADGGILPEYPWPKGPPLGAGMPSGVGLPPTVPPTPVGPRDLLSLSQLPLNPFLPYVQNWPPLLPPPGASAPTAQLVPGSASTLAPSTSGPPPWPTNEFDLLQDALRAGAESIGRRGRRAPIPSAALPPPPEHLNSAEHWGAGPSEANTRPPVQNPYLSPVPRAPRWDQVVPAPPWSILPDLPSPTSWGNTQRDPKCYALDGYLHCTELGGRQFKRPAPQLPDGSDLTPDELRDLKASPFSHGQGKLMR